MSVVVDVADLKKHYETGAVVTKALNGVSFKVEDGEFLGIMGPSGSGKSTLLHQVSLLDEPTSGTVNLLGENVSQLSAQQRTQFRLTKLGFVFQQYRNLPELTALENVMLPARATGMYNHDVLDAARELLEEVGLGHRVDHKPFELSGGEQQRVSIARALINEPKILLADEPTAQLDTDSSEQVLQLCEKFNEERGQTIIMVSHEPEQRKYFDRVIHLRDGVIEDVTES